MGIARAFGYLVLMVLGQAAGIAGTLVFADHRSFWRGTGAFLLLLLGIPLIVGSTFASWDDDDSFHVMSPGGAAYYLLLVAPLALLVLSEGEQLRVRAMDDQVTAVVTEASCTRRPDQGYCPNKIRVATAADRADLGWVKRTCEPVPAPRVGATVEVRVDTDRRWDPVFAECGLRVPWWGYLLAEIPATLQFLVLLVAGFRRRR